MEVNKEIGEWFDYKNPGNLKGYTPTQIDDYAYHLYLNDINLLIGDSYKVEQVRFIHENKYFNKFKKYYIFAEQLLRKEKIEKILNENR